MNNNNNLKKNHVKKNKKLSAHRLGNAMKKSTIKIYETVLGREQIDIGESL